MKNWCRSTRRSKSWPRPSRSRLGWSNSLLRRAHGRAGGAGSWHLPSHGRPLLGLRQGLASERGPRPVTSWLQRSFGEFSDAIAGPFALCLLETSRSPARRTTMSDENLFHLALEKPAAERPAFLEQACAVTTHPATCGSPASLPRDPGQLPGQVRGEPRSDHRIELQPDRRRRRPRSGRMTNRPAACECRGPGQPHRPVQAAAADRRGGHGHGLHGRADPAGAAQGRAEAHQGRHGQPPGPRPLRGRAAGPGPDGPPQHRQGARRRRHRARAGPTS